MEVWLFNFLKVFKGVSGKGRQRISQWKQRSVLSTCFVVEEVGKLRNLTRESSAVRTCFSRGVFVLCVQRGKYPGPHLGEYETRVAAVVSEFMSF